MSKSKATFKDLISGSTPVLIDFYADWCGPCKSFAPILQELKSDLGDAIRIVKIDVDANPELSGKLGVRSIPTVMIFQNGELKWQGMGVQSKPVLKQQIQALSA